MIIFIYIIREILEVEENIVQKIAFIAHSYHKKTHSYDFIFDYLKEFFDVELIFDEEWETGKKIEWEKFDESYKAVVIFQMFPDEKEDFEKIGCKNVVYLPMYDQVENWHFSKWLMCKNVKIVSFSSTLHKKLKKWGFKSIYAQYFIEPKEFSPGNINEVFFWQRLSKINISTVKKILKNSGLEIHIHKTVDPGQNFVQPTREDEEKFKITYSDWFDTKAQMQDFIKTKGIYIAPRFSEGIGMSFLEAIAQGKVVIANNKPTMNEYIKNGETGFLCNFKFRKTIKLKNLEDIQKNTYDYAVKGYGNWLIDRKKIVEFINLPYRENKLSLYTKICMPFLLFDRKKIIKIKFGSNASLTIFGIKIFGP